jgi:hypothetical protein
MMKPLCLMIGVLFASTLLSTSLPGPALAAYDIPPVSLPLVPDSGFLWYCDATRRRCVCSGEADCYDMGKHGPCREPPACIDSENICVCRY